MAKPKKWTDIYPQGTEAGDEEAKFFRSLARNHKYAYRSTPQIMSDTGLSRQRVEEIIEKYASMKPPVILPHPSNADHWGYWERCEEDETCEESLCQKDQQQRIDRQNAPIVPDLIIMPSAPTDAGTTVQKPVVIDIPACYVNHPVSAPTSTVDWTTPQITWPNDIQFEFENSLMDFSEIKINWDSVPPFDFTITVSGPPLTLGQWKVNP